MKKYILAVVVLLSMGSAVAKELRVATYNIKHGVGMDGKLNLERTAEVLKKLEADVIALQEVDRHCARSGNVDQAAVIAKKLGMHHYFAKAINLGEGEYGNAVLSKYPIAASKSHALPGGGEKRVVAEIQISVGNETISVCSVHLDHRGEQVRLEQIKAIENAVKPYKHPVILTGDFNAKPDSKVLKYMAAHWLLVEKQGSRKTFPAPEPKVEIDYCALRNVKPKVASCEVVKEPVASDHRPLLIKLKW